MAQKRKVSAAKGKTAAKSGPMSEGKRQMTAVLLFAVAVFLLFVSIIKGQNVWSAMHNFMFGLFGICAFIVPIILGAAAVLLARDKMNGKAKARFIEFCVVTLFVAAAIDVFATPSNEKADFWAHIVNVYENAFSGKMNAGFTGALVGHSIFALFGKIGACITVVLLMFVFFMLATGTTLSQFFKTVSKPVKQIEKQAQEAYATRKNQEEEKEEEAKEETGKEKRNEYDMPLDDDLPETVNEENAVEPDVGQKRERLINAYRGVDGKNMENNGDAADEIPDLAGKPEAEHKGREDKPADGAEEKVDTYSYPPVSLLKETPNDGGSLSTSDLNATANLLVDTLKSFGVETKIVDISRGPVVTRYELQPSAGVKINRITNLVDDITLNLATAGVRIEAPIPNKAAVGIEVPNKKASMVTLREIIESPDFANSQSKLTAVLGKDIGGNAVVCNIASMPHGLIAGATNSGKSVCINSIIMSILYKATPEEVKLILIDPKVVELGIYNGIPHLLIPVVTDPRKASGALTWAVMEMEKRYKLFAENNVRDINGYNEMAEFSDDMPKMPQILIVIDELADLMMTAAKEVEESICRIAQKARAAGMHLIIATQRPSVDVVTGLIKANIPTRIAFAVSSQVDSRTILDVGGAEKLLGRGDMLYSPVGASKPSRIQGCFVSDKEINSVVDYIKTHHDHDYDEAVMEEIEKNAEEVNKKGKVNTAFEDDEDTGADAMLDQAIEVVVEAGLASTSLLQRRLRLGYARAARIVDQMYERGIIGPYEGSKPRKVLITKEQLMEKKASESNL